MAKRRNPSDGGVVARWLGQWLGIACLVVSGVAIAAVPALLYSVSHSPYGERLMDGFLPGAGSAPVVIAWCAILLFVAGFFFIAGLALLLVSRDIGTPPSLPPRRPRH